MQHTDKAIAEFEAWWQQQLWRECFEDVKDQMRNVWLASRRELVVQMPRKVRTLTLFCSRAGKPVSYETVKEAFQALREKTGIHDVKIHDIRAKSLTDADREGKNAQTLGGHTDARMTARYLRGRLPKIAKAPTMPSRIG